MNLWDRAKTQLLIGCIAAVGLLAMQPASAKCAGDFRVFSGVVTDKAGHPIPGAMVGISWSDMDGTTGPALALTDGKGRYSIPVSFDTYSGKGHIEEDECKQRFEVISLSAFKGSLRSPYAKVRIGDAENVRLPPAVIWLELDDEGLSRFIKKPRR